MKQFSILILTLCCSASFLVGQTKKGKVDMAFDKEKDGIISHDFGSIVNGANGLVEFTFTNTGTKDILISDVKSSCNCAVPSYSKDPVKPGHKGSVTVEYNTRLTGVFNKTIVVYSNANNSPIRLVIRGKVNPAPNQLKPGTPGSAELGKIQEQEDVKKGVKETPAAVNRARGLASGKAAAKEADKNKAGQQNVKSGQAKTAETQQTAVKSSGTATKK